MGRVIRRLFPSTLAAALLVCAGGVRADDSLEYTVKANYLYKFAPFVEWPQSDFDSSSDPFSICVAGKDPFGAILDQAVRNQRVGPHAIIIKRLKIAETNSGCRIMYIGGSDEQSVTRALEVLHGEAILTVTSEPGAIIRFVLDKNHVRFDIDDEAAAQSKLVISSKLLGLARSAIPRKQP